MSRTLVMSQQPRSILALLLVACVISMNAAPCLEFHSENGVLSCIYLKIQTISRRKKIFFGSLYFVAGYVYTTWIWKYMYRTSSKYMYVFTRGLGQRFHLFARKRNLSQWRPEEFRFLRCLLRSAENATRHWWLAWVEGISLPLIQESWKKRHEKKTTV